MNAMNDSHTLPTLPGTGWHHEDIKAEVRKRFGSLAALSARLGVTRQAISGVLVNPQASITLEKRIAAELGVPPFAIWPTRWRMDGSPVARADRSLKI